MGQVLEGITVLDFTWGMAGSIATMVLSDFGAEVIKVEPPGGDPFRAFPASRLWNRGKKSIILDLKRPQAREQLLRLVAGTDVVIESFRPGVAERLGIGYEALRAQRKDLVYCSITGFGPRGQYAHYKGYEGVVAAKAGRMMILEGLVDREGPAYAAVKVGNHAAALAAVRGIVAALYVRDRTGQGQKVETSLLQALTPYDMHQWIVWQMMIRDPERFPNDPQGDPRRMTHLGYTPARTKDGRWIQLANLVDRLFRASLHTIGLGAVFEDPRFATAPQLSEENREALREMILKRMQEKTLDEWMEIFVHHTRDVAAEPFLHTHEGLDHPQVVYNGHIQEVRDPEVGVMRQLGPLLVMGATPGSIKGPAPRPGEHTGEVLGSIRSASTGASSLGQAGLPPHPLAGITVLDLSTVIAGPLGGSLVAELGARVIRVETLEGDWMRGNVRGVTANRTMGGTEGVSVDLKTPEGQQILRALVTRADVLHHNMRPGAPERLGIGYDQLRPLNPRLVYLYVAGYGSKGPYSHRPAMHPIPGAVLGGALTQLGRGVLPPPDAPLSLEEIKELSRKLARANDSNPDPNTSMAVSTGIMLGLYARERYGIGQYLEVTMLGANAYANADDFFWYEGKPLRPLPDAGGYGLHALYRLYRAQKGWVFLACLFEHEWRALCAAIGRKNLLEEPRFATGEARRQHDDALAEVLAQVFATRPAAAWEQTLAAADVACVQAEDRGMYHFFAEDSHVQENGFTTEVEHPRWGAFWRHSPVITFSLTPGRVGPGPLRGQHTRAVLRELGYSDSQIAELRQRRVVDWEEP
ncbi:MAG: CoA transferase [Chloroflexi bacterium]|nr:CoA transferase [Chloroflexota bacterium]